MSHAVSNISHYGNTDVISEFLACNKITNDVTNDVNIDIGHCMLHSSTNQRAARTVRNTSRYKFS